MKLSFRSVLFAALVGGVLCACSKPTATQPSEPSDPGRPLASTPSTDAEAPPSEPSIAPSASPPEPEPPSDPETSCGRFFGPLNAERLAEGTFRTKRADLLQSVDRALAYIEEHGTFVAPVPAKTAQQEVGYLMLAVGKNASCGLRHMDRIVRVGGAPLSDPARRKEIYDSLSTASRLDVEVERDGKSLVLVYLLAD